MYALFWFAGFASLLLLHFVVLPRLTGVVLKVGVGGDRIPEEAARSYFFFWSGCVAIFTVGFFMTSVLVFNRAAVLGTVFLAVAAGAWLVRLLSEGTQSEEETRGFELGLTSTLTGTLFGTVVGLGISRLL